MTGRALHDTATGTGSFFQRIIGGISGSLLWSVLFLIIIYLLYLKLANHCLSPFKKLQSSHTTSVTEIPLFLTKLPRFNTLQLFLINPRLLTETIHCQIYKKARQDFICECMNSMYPSLCHSSRLTSKFIFFC